MGVFTITSIWAIFAYVWLYICLKVWTPEIITMEEGVLTLSYFILLIITAFAADKYN
jgi:magnesium/proton exchanger